MARDELLSKMIKTLKGKSRNDCIVEHWNISQEGDAIKVVAYLRQLKRIQKPVITTLIKRPSRSEK